MPYNVFNKSETVKVLFVQLCPTLCDTMDCSPPGSADQGILQVSILEWPLPSLRDFPNPRSKLRCPAVQADFSSDFS